MNDRKTRVRFAPSPTGGLHLGGVRTALYNYLFARSQGGEFILRIEDTDQTRFVAGAEAYIFDCLAWLGIEPDESARHGGPFGPYRQSERKSSYAPLAEQLIAQGKAYYAFDTPEELESMRRQYITEENPQPQYDHKLRMKMRNSLTLPAAEVEALLQRQTPYVVRIKMPDQEVLEFEDMIRGKVSFNTALVDDKVLLKADGMPTYHLAVVADDYQMQITHVFRGEEWLPSTPVHILLWKYLYGLDKMPQWAHLPLILGPEGKLSKRDGAKYGFPVFAMNWTDPASGVMTEGFKERGFLPEAFINLLALLGWNDGSGQELFSLEALISRFAVDRVHSAGARFDFEKAKWFNHEWIKELNNASLLPRVGEVLQGRGLDHVDPVLLEKIIGLVKDRCTLLTDFYEQSVYFFQAPEHPDLGPVKEKWDASKTLFFNELIRNYELATGWDAEGLEHNFKEIAAVNQLKPGALMLPFRIMLVGGKFGPGVFEIAALIGKSATIERIREGLRQLSVA
ncbi:glutamate--tRNA ligase [Niabella terrae]